MLLLERKPDRLLIEPTGLAALSGILNTLDRPGVRELLDLRSIVCLLDPVRIREDLVREEVSDQVEAADVLLANRSDLASKEQLQKFDRWGAALFPPKRFVGQIEQGRIPLELLDLVSKRDTAIRRAGHTHGTDHQHKEAPESQTQTPKTDIVCGPDRPIVRRSHRSTVTSTVGWICFETLEFDAKRISCWLNEIAQLPGARRTKAVLRTNEGWWAFNFANGAEDVHPSGYRRDSRIEFIFEGQQFPNDQELEDALRRCLRLESELVGEKHAGERSS
jgi:G3E family GTPase